MDKETKNKNSNTENKKSLKNIEANDFDNIDAKKKRPNLREIRAENKKKRSESKIISNLGKDFVKEEKEDFIKKIKSEENIDEKKKLKEELKKIFKNGEAINSKGNIIDIKGLEKYYCNGINCEHILHNINLEIKEGEIVVILGASGSGKTTLLNIMSGLTNPTLGDVVVAGKNMLYLSEAGRTKFRADNLSFVFQSYNLIPSLTVVENIKVGENLRSKDVEKIEMSKILETLDLEKQAKKYPFQLSGGQNQRVSIGRALAKNPKLLFADEPTGALDEEKGREALQMLLDINEKYKTTLIMVTHNPNFANIADMVLYIKDGRVDRIKKNKTKLKASKIDWS